jgi:hypothetical protein
LKGGFGGVGVVTTEKEFCVMPWKQAVLMQDDELGGDGEIPSLLL